MKKIKLLMAAMLSMMAWNGVMAQTDSEYEAALAAITNGTYRIKTDVNGIYYYVTTDGGLTKVKDNAGFFEISKTEGGDFKSTSIRISSGNKRFTNPPLSGSVANLHPGAFATSTSDRPTNGDGYWERQVFFLKDGKYAIRSCNTPHATSSWGDAGRTFWTWEVDPVTPCYSYDPAYVWELDVPPVIINVTYKLVESDGTTVVSSTTVKQEANSALISPLPGTGMDFNGHFQEKFYYDYTPTGTIGDTDCTITITRTEKSGVVKSLDDLSNIKAYYIGCDRGALLTKDGTIASTSHSTLHDAAPANFAILSYEDENYIYSIADKKFVLNDGSLAEMPSHGIFDAIQMTPQTVPYFLFTFKIDYSTTYGLNTNGTGALNGCVINSWVTPDAGDQYYMVEAADFDPTAALDELEAYFHPSYFVTYVVKDELGNTIFASDPQPTKLNTKITALPAEFQRSYYTYNEVDVTISEEETNIEFTATWNGPFKLSENFANAQWQNMAIRGTWYVTSAIKDGDGAYKTQNANTMGLVEDSYQWAFLGDGYNGFRIINKAEGELKSFAYTDAAKTDAGIPTVMDYREGSHLWKIVASTNKDVPAGSFCLNVPGTNLYINQYGGAGGSLKFWNSGNNVGDPGSAFTIFDVPTNFASYLVEDGIAAAFEGTGYFAFTDAAKTTLGWDPAYKTDCPFETYKSLKETLAAIDMTDLSQFVLPETGYYTLKNRNYETNNYMGIDPSDANMYGNYAAASAAKQIVKLTKTGEATYTIGLMGKFAPATITKSGQVTATAEAGTYTVSVPAVGYGAFSADPSEQYAALHRDAQGDIVGWETASKGSQWAVEDATSIEFTIGEAGYATAYLPCPVAIPDTINAYTGKMADSYWLKLLQINGTIPSATPVILEAKAGTYTLAIADDVDAIVDNDLKGTFEPIEAADKYVLAKPEDKVGFYLAESGTIAAGKAYLELEQPSDVKAFFFTNGVATGIANVEKTVENGAIYNIAGQRVNKARKGIYIVNGKKVVK